MSRKKKAPLPASPTLSELEIKRQELLLEQKRIELQEGLPHLYGWKWYPWARRFFESTNKINLLTAANQISKSSSMIRKCIHWATDQALWPSLWRSKPRMFWYFYPTFGTATAEFETKWQEFLPQGNYKTDPVYGWSEEYKNKEIHAIYFNSGVNIYFHSYSQKEADLQAGSVSALFADEEMPVEKYDELMFRLSATDGYFHSAFTATLGQEFWRLAMEPEPHEEENLKSAFKQTVSMFDCQLYEDGTASHWTNDKIQMVIDRCKDHDEVQRRVFGKFIRKKEGRKCPSFDLKLHMKPAHPLPKEWIVYSAVDPGSGGDANHPAAICFVAVRPDFREGRVFLGWRGDGIQTSAGDVLEKYIELKKLHKLTPAAQKYDWACRDFFIIATNNGEAFSPADKDQKRGPEIVDTLFKYNMLAIYETDELHKLANELASLRTDTAKRKAKDDFYDALRYCVADIPWDFTGIVTQQPVATAQPKSNIEVQLEERRKAFEEAHEEEAQSIEQEFEFWNDSYDGY